MSETRLAGEFDTWRVSHLMIIKEFLDVLQEQRGNVWLCGHKHVVDRKHRLNEGVFFLRKILLGRFNKELTAGLNNTETVKNFA